MRRDYELGKERSRQDLDQARERAQEEHEAHSGGTGPSEPAATQPGAGGEGGPPASEPALVQATEETWNMSPGP
ncbi:MAG: hypothetical protein ACR2LY_04120 [Thermoleophilaceae bacterium]